MAAAEKHEAPLPFWPIAMTRDLALSYTQVSRAQLDEWERRGLIRFRPRGANGAMITERAQLDAAVRLLFGDVAEDMDFG